MHLLDIPESYQKTNMTGVSNANSETTKIDDNALIDVDNDKNIGNFIIRLVGSCVSL